MIIINSFQNDIIYSLSYDIHSYKMSCSRFSESQQVYSHQGRDAKLCGKCLCIFLLAQCLSFRCIILFLIGLRLLPVCSYTLCYHNTILFIIPNSHYYVTTYSTGLETFPYSAASESAILIKSSRDLHAVCLVYSFISIILTLTYQSSSVFIYSVNKDKSTCLAAVYDCMVLTY